MSNNTRQSVTHSTMPVPLRLGLGVWMSAVILGTFMFVPAARGFSSPESARLVVFHVPCAMVAVIAYIVSAVYAVAYLRKGSAIDDEKSAISAALGLLFTVLATVTGMVFARVQWGSFWNWDPRQTSILMLIMLYAAYFMLRSSIPGQIARARISAAYSIMAAVIMPFLVIVLPRMMASLHPSDTLTQREGLAPEYRIAMIAAAIGYAWLYVWMFRMQVHVAEYMLAARRIRVE